MTFITEASLKRLEVWRTQRSGVRQSSSSSLPIGQVFRHRSESGDDGCLAGRLTGSSASVIEASAGRRRQPADTALPIKGNSEGMERSGMEEELPGRVGMNYPHRYSLIPSTWSIAMASLPE